MNCIDLFIQTLKTENSKNQYKTLLRKFFNLIEVNPDEYIIDIDRDYYEDIQRYILYLVSNDCSKGTVRNYAYKLMKFLRYNEVEISTSQEMKLKDMIPDKPVNNQVNVLSQDDIKSLMNHADIKMKALVSFLISSGCRVGEVLELYIDDVELDKSPVRVHISGSISKTGNQRTTFINEESKHFLLDWLDMRDEWIKSRNMTFIKEDNPDIKKKLFPVDYSTVTKSWILLLKKIGKDKRNRDTNRYVYPLHSLRKYFSTHMRQSMDWELVEILLGHSQGVKGRYYNPSIDLLSEAYADASHEVNIFASGVPRSKIEQLEAEIKRRDDDIKDSKKDIRSLRQELERMQFRKKRYDKLINEIRKLEREYFQTAPQSEESFELEEKIRNLELQLEKLNDG